jgi:hypothetical protein
MDVPPIKKNCLYNCYKAVKKLLENFSVEIKCFRMEVNIYWPEQVICHHLSKRYEKCDRLFGEL